MNVYDRAAATQTLITVVAIVVLLTGFYFVPSSKKQVPNKAPDLSSSLYEAWCVEGVVYFKVGQGIAPLISKETLAPQRCEEVRQ